MNDRELLELSASALGFPVHWGHVFSDGKFQLVPWLLGIRWNPLENDADALGLAVKLNIVVSPAQNHVRVFPLGVEQVPDIMIEFKNDGLSEVRLAIVRCAAEIGKGLK